MLYSFYKKVNTLHISWILRFLYFFSCTSRNYYGEHCELRRSSSLIPWKSTCLLHLVPRSPQIRNWKKVQSLCKYRRRPCRRALLTFYGPLNIDKYWTTRWPARLRTAVPPNALSSTSRNAKVHVVKEFLFIAEVSRLHPRCSVKEARSFLEATRGLRSTWRTHLNDELCRIMMRSTLNKGFLSYSFQLASLEVLQHRKFVVVWKPMSYMLYLIWGHYARDEEL